MGFWSDYVAKPAMNIVIGHFLEKGMKMAKEHVAEHIANIPDFSSMSVPKMPKISMPKMPMPPPKVVKYPPHVSHVQTSSPLKRTRSKDEVIEAEFRLMP